MIGSARSRQGRRTWRRLLSLLVFLVLLGIDLLLVAYLTRQYWLEPIARSTLEDVLGDELNGGVRVGPIEGSWIRDLRTTVDFEVAPDTEAVLREVRDLRLTAAFHLPALVEGDWSGLRILRAEADLVRLRLPPPSDGSDDGTAGEPFDPRSLEPFLHALPGGAELNVERLLVRSHDDRIVHDGPLRVRIQPGESVRIAVVHARGDVELLVHRESGLTTTVGARLEEPGSLLRDLGIENRLFGGTARILARVEPLAPNVAATVRWEGGEIAERGPARLFADMRADPRSVHGNVDLELPGIRVEGDALHVPVAADLLEGLRGAVTVDLRGPGAWEEWVPEELRGYLPVTGRLHAEFGPDVVRIGRGRLVGASWSLGISGGEFPRRGDGGRLAVTAILTEPRSIALDPTTTLLLSGRVSGELRGSVTAPRFRGRAELETGGIADWRWRRARTDVAFDGRRIALSDLAVEAVRREGRPEDSGARYVGDLTIELRDDAANEPLRIDADGTLTVVSATAALEDPNFESVSPGPVRVDATIALPGGGTLPFGTAEVAFDEFRTGAQRAPSQGRIRARVEPRDDGSRTVEAFLEGRLDAGLLRLTGLDPRLFEGAGSADVVLSADGIVPADPTSLPQVRVVADVDGLGIGTATPTNIALRAALDPDERRVRIETAKVTGPAELEADGSVPLGDGDVQLSLRAEIEDFAPLSAVSVLVPSSGRLTLDARIDGPLETPSVEAAVDLRVPDLAAIGLAWPPALGAPPQGPLSAELDATMSNGVVALEAARVELMDGDTSAARVELSGTPPLAWQNGTLAAIGVDSALSGTVRLERTVTDLGVTTIESRIVWDPTSLRTEELTVSTPHGTASGNLAIAQFAEALAASTPGDAAIDGRISLDALDLAAVPAAWARSLALSGSVTGQVRVEGSLAAPSPSGQMELRDGTMKLAAATPTVSGLEGTLRLTENAAEIETLRGRLGVGEVRLTGSWSSADGPLLANLDDARLRLDFHADDALVLRSTGIKMRVDSGIVAEGTIANLSVTGDVTIDYGKIIRRISLVPEVGQRGGAGVEAGIPFFSIPPPLGNAIRFDVDITTAEPIEIVTHVINTPVDVALELRGTGAAPQLEGAVSTNSGTLKMPAITFGIRQGLLTFRPEATRFPQLRLVATARRHSIDLTATATGRIDSIEVFLSSVPPLDQRELVVLASTGQLPDRLRDQGIAGQATLVGGYLATEIFDYYFGSDSTETGESFIDRFHFYSGREIGRSGTESLTVDFDITKQFGLQAERDIFEDYNMGLVYRLRF